MSHGVAALHRSSGWMAVPILLIIFALGGWTAMAVQEVTKDGVIHVMNGATPPKGTQTLQLEELWRVGGEDDEESIFGVIVQGLTDEKGNVYLLDMQLSQVSVYSPDGELIRTLSREGEGPGEVRNPSDMIFMPDGNLGLLQTFPGKIIKVDLNGVPAGQITIGGNDPTQGGFAAVIDANCRDGKLVLAGVHVSQGQTSQTRTSYLSAYAEDGSEKTRYWGKVTTLDFTNFEIIEKDQHFVYPRRWSIGLGGKIYAAPDRENYEINVYAADGTLERVIERKFTNRKRTEEERARIKRLIEGQSRRFPGEVKTEIEDTEPAIGSVDVLDDGTVWIVHSSSAFEQPEGIMQTFDVFDDQGHFIRQVAIACEGDGEEDALIFLGSDRLLLIKGLMAGIQAMQGASSASEDEEEPAPMEVVYYSIPG